MGDISDQGFITRSLGIGTSTIIGTAVGTTTVSKNPGALDGLLITHRPASATFILYNSDGTSTSVLGTIVMGTSTAEDPPAYIPFPRTFNKLTIASTTTNAGAIVFWNQGA